MPGIGLEAVFEVGGEAAQGVVVVAVDLERDLRAHARQHVIEAMRDRLPDGDACRQHGQARADVGQHLFAAARRLAQVDIELAVVDALGVLVELGAAGAAADRAHLRHVGDNLLGEAADAIGFGQADAGLQHDADQHRALVERRQEGARQRQAG